VFNARKSSMRVLTGYSYRLGVLGNLTSREMRDAGYHANNSLRDQRCALQWVNRHIVAFGGDSERVTVFGESAGAGMRRHPWVGEELTDKNQRLCYISFSPKNHSSNVVCRCPARRSC
jgi:hypothetical protein